ncbi:odorant receptor 7a-like [Schistocerca gregaria]|uniref:Odorant receptor 54 n=1 Tax=Schistocerca gregaria TaxID=7010 RepID=A0A221I0B2_SCHGR|nr:odorant receptor 7a-like [Schistocerca gregaria]ASM47124.1 odorant receptor 54 [Schistocerca gregaria]
MPAIKRQRRLPYQQLRWLDTSSAAVYGASYALQCTATFFCSFINTHLDVFFMAVMIHVADQFRILAARFAALRLDADCKPESRVLQDGSSRLGEELYRELSLCIQNHQDLVRLVHLLDDVMSPIAMTQFVVGAVNACMVLFPATYAETVSSAAYECCWLGADRKRRRALLLVMCRAQRPLQLTAGKLYPINRPTFLSLLQVTYSYYTLLQNLNSR